MPYLSVGGKGTQEKRNYKTYEGFFAFCSFVSCFYAIFAHRIYNKGDSMAKKNEIIVKDVAIKTISKDGIDYISWK